MKRFGGGGVIKADSLRKTAFGVRRRVEGGGYGGLISEVEGKMQRGGVRRQGVEKPKA
jgi:hypothetical protein